MADKNDIFAKAASLIAETNKEKNEKKKLLEEDRKALIEQLGFEVTRQLEPVLSAMVENSRASRQDLQTALNSLKIDAPVMPEIKLPPINVPQPKVTVSAPDVKVPQMPEIKIPPTVFPDRMTVDIDGIDNKAPLPVMMMDTKGKPMQFGMSGGGKSDFFTIKDIRGSTASIIDQVDGALKITGSLSASLSLDYGSGEIGDNTARFVQATDAISSVAVKEIFGSTVTSDVINGDNRVRVSVETGGSGLTDSELRATAVPVSQVSGSAWSTEVQNTVTVDGSDVVQPVSQVSGANWSVEMTNPMTPIAVRGSRSTAYATISSDAETQLVAGVASTYLDMIYVMGANQSDGAVTLDFAAGGGGATVLSLEIPANSTAGVAPATAIPMPEVAQQWVINFADSDTTGTTVDVTALFSQET